MSPDEDQLPILGLKIGVAAALVTNVVSWSLDARPNYLGSGIMFLFFFLLGVPGMFFRNPRQLIWYRRCVFLPPTILLGLLALGAWIRLEPLFVAAAVGTGLGILLIPPVWIIGAFWIACRPPEVRLC